MNYSERFRSLNNKFTLGKDCYIEESDINLKFFPFNSKFRPLLLNSNDESIIENRSFVYPVFYPAKKQK